MRLDIYLNKNYELQSRNKADELIKANKIKVNGKIISKSSYKIKENDEITILEENFYVSRSAYKLKHFLDEINISIKDKKALDIGSSTGGFTQILLENKVKEVTCVDVGSNQLHEKIKNNKNIKFFENTDIRNFKNEQGYELVTCDVSFISILYIIEDINRLSTNEIIILYKPQYEVGSNVKRNTKGVLKDTKEVKKVREKFLAFCVSMKWTLIYNNTSKISGKEGNSEELFYFKKS